MKTGGEAGGAERTTPSIIRTFPASLSGALSIAQFLRAVNYLALAVHWRIGYAHHLPNGFRMTIRTHVDRMDKFRIIGGKKLKGGVAISGAKNSALPCLAAALLTPETVTLRNVPYVRDLITMRRLLEDLGCTVLVPELRTHQINAGTVEDYEAPYELVKTMRASVLALGPLLGRFGQASVSLPGGCAIGQRPIDLHLMALEKMGAKIELRGGVVEAGASRLRGADIEFETVTVTGTENVMMAAALADGVTRISRALQGRRRDHGRLPRIPDRHAGAVHGAHDASLK